MALTQKQEIVFKNAEMALMELEKTNANYIYNNLSAHQFVVTHI